MTSQAYLEAFYKFCSNLGGTTADTMCPILEVSLIIITPLCVIQHFLSSDVIIWLCTTLNKLLDLNTINMHVLLCFFKSRPNIIFQEIDKNVSKNALFHNVKVIWEKKNS